MCHPVGFWTVFDQNWPDGTRIFYTEARMAGERKKKQSLGQQLKREGKLYLFFVPSALLLILFSYIPMTGLIMAFKENPNILGAPSVIQGILDAKWVGLDNFKKIFTNVEILKALRNTLIISLEKTVFIFPIPIAIALLLNELQGKIVKKTLRFTMYLPYFLSWVTVAGICATLLNKDTGMINNILEYFGPLRELPLPQAIQRSCPVLVITQGWKWIGYSTVIYLSAITALDTDLLEAAKIDGATKLQRIWHVTLPGILPIIAINFVLRMGSVLDAGFEQIFIMYSPYIKENADILGTYTYRLIREASLLPQYALSTAVGLFNGVVSMVLVLLTNWFAKKYLKTGLW